MDRSEQRQQQTTQQTGVTDTTAESNTTPDTTMNLTPEMWMELDDDSGYEPQNDDSVFEADQIHELDKYLNCPPWEVVAEVWNMRNPHDKMTTSRVRNIAQQAECKIMAHFPELAEFIGSPVEHNTFKGWKDARKMRVERRGGSHKRPNIFPPRDIVHRFTKEAKR